MYKILQILPADGWYAVTNLEGQAATEALFCKALIFDQETGEERLTAFTANDQLEPVDEDPMFLGYWAPDSKVTLEEWHAEAQWMESQTKPLDDRI